MVTHLIVARAAMVRALRIGLVDGSGKRTREVIPSRGQIDIRCLDRRASDAHLISDCLPIIRGNDGATSLTRLAGKLCADSAQKTHVDGRGRLRSSV